MKTFNIIERLEIATSFPPTKTIVGTAIGKIEAQNMVDVLTNDNISAVDNAVPFVPYHMRTRELKIKFSLKNYSYEVAQNEQ